MEDQGQGPTLITLNYHLLILSPSFSLFLNWDIFPQNWLLFFFVFFKLFYYGSLSSPTPFFYSSIFYGLFSTFLTSISLFSHLILAFSYWEIKHSYANDLYLFITLSSTKTHMFEQLLNQQIKTRGETMNSSFEMLSKRYHSPLVRRDIIRRRFVLS